MNPPIKFTKPKPWGTVAVPPASKPKPTAGETRAKEQVRRFFGPAGGGK